MSPSPSPSPSPLKLYFKVNSAKLRLFSLRMADIAVRTPRHHLVMGSKEAKIDNQWIISLLNLSIMNQRYHCLSVDHGYRIPRCAATSAVEVGGVGGIGVSFDGGNCWDRASKSRSMNA